ncbi:hypothetical protein TVAG_472950 [Trichomonas vaginalis G3]|uniref:Uncharacterized protein n=1 Tax=Trichomonas vaginalis (strain ATCC PRA-98 / G3) TaxID=412133 RepID=A2ERU1_TRIV3|nr:hypothetical protein TVAGG3_0020210 [Trichomonas vaginalis G3]EAY04608.1 hypothetical protein TVAG_472950 [Trichomonas vaginalis G3]KAI5539628.1 hypothetical protein TVAGG3_0020210 [Trichomonas vaginalis G3]|eukprot:XP_001316831.1 hypothetical protein [Trichomonas vaginalis G3]
MDSSPDSGGECDIYSMNDRIQQLEQEKSILIQENKTLKSQFDESLKELQKIDEIKCENTDLKKNLSESLTNLQDLQRRLDISLKNNQELNRKLQSIQESNQNSFNFELQSLKRQLNENNENHAKEVEELQRNIDDNAAALSEMQKQIAIANSLTSKTINLANVFFEVEFPDIFSLHSFLSDVRNKPVQTTPEIQNIQDNELLLTQLKTKLNKEKQKYQRLKVDHFSQQQDFQFQLNEKDRQISEITERLQKAISENNEQQLNYENQISELKIKKPTRNASVQVISVINTTEPTQSSSETNTNDNNTQLLPTTDQSQAIKALKAQNADLLEEIKDLKQKKDKLTEKLKKLPQDSQQNLDTELKRLKGELDFKNKDIESMKLQLMAARASNEEANTTFIALKNEKEKIIDCLNTLQGQYEDQKTEISRLTFERNGLASLLQRLSNITTYLEHKDQKVPKPLPIILPPSKTEEIILWNFEPLPADLRAILERVASNYSASNTSRLKSVVSVVGQYINDLNETTKIELSELRQSINDFNKKHVQLVSDLADVFGEEVNESNVIEFILSLKDQIDTLNAELESSNSKVIDFLQRSNMNSFDEIISNFAKKEKAIQSLTNQLEDEKEEAESLKRDVKMLKKAFSRAEKQLSASNESLKESLLDCENAKAKLREQLANQRKQCCDLVNEMAELRQQCKDEVDEVRENYDDLLSQIEMSKLDNSNRSNTAVNTINSEKQAILKKLNEKEKAIERLTDELETQAKRNQQFSDEIERLTDKIDEQKICFDEKLSKEKEQLINDYEAKINDYMKKSKTDAELVKKTTETLKNNEQKQQILLQKVKELERQLALSESQRKNTIECAERQKKLFEAQQKSVMINADIKKSEYTYQIKQEYEQKERQIINTFAQNFHRFVDINNQIDINSFQSAIVLLKSELERLQTIERSIRSICGASEGDKTEDALTFFAIQHKRATN